MKTRKEILARMKEIKTRSAAIMQDMAAENADLPGLDTETADLVIENRKLQTELNLLDLSEGMVEYRTLDTMGANPMENIMARFATMAREDVLASVEYRSAFIKALQKKDLNEIEQRAYDSGTSTGGAYVIPTITANVLFDKMVKTVPMLQEIQLLRIKGNVNFSVEGTRNAAAQHTENAAVTPAADTLTKVSLGGYEYMKVLRISRTVQTMGIDAFEGWLTDMLAEDIALQIEDKIINGTGSTQPKGVEHARTWTAGTAAIEYTNAGNPTYDNVMDLIALLPARYDAGALILTTKKFLYGSLAKIKDDQKNPILVKDMVNGIGLVIMGYPVRISDKVAEKTLYLGNFKKIVGNLGQDVEVDASAQSGFLNNSVDYRGTALFDCTVALPDAFVKLTEAAGE